jgi:hypothetical protein
MNIESTLKELPRRSSTTTTRPSVLAAQHSAGISKKRTKATKMSSKARRRHERGIQMAEAVLDRTMHKVEKSKGRGRSVQDRAKAWDLINKKAEEEEAKAAQRGEEESDEEAAAGKEDGWVTDEDMDANTETKAAANADPTAGADFIPIDDDEDIL